ncbi:MAG: porin family protein [Deltaproteobacteria bacterium]|nr:porin family protein [Deltaproteobacteria bacterium]
MRLLSILFLAVVLSLSATAAPYSLGIQGGLSMANVSSEPTADTGSRTSLSFGATADVQLYEWLYLNPELMYVAGGFTSTSGTTTTTTSVNWLAVPVNLKAKFNATPELMPYVFVGPSLGFKLSAKSGDTDASANVKSTAFDLGFGAGMEYWVNPSIAILLNGRYVLGLSNTTDQASSALLANVVTKNKMFMFLAGATFAL